MILLRGSAAPTRIALLITGTLWLPALLRMRAPSLARCGCAWARTAVLSQYLARRAFFRIDWHQAQASREEYAKRSIISLW